MTELFPDDAHLNIGKLQRVTYDAMTALSNTAAEQALATGLDPLILELVRMRASQLNGCAFCLRMHARDAIEKGESPDRLAVLAAWWESQYFTAAEQQALLITERVTNVAHERAPLLPTRAEAPLSADQISAVAWLAIVMNAWNRVAIGSHYPVHP